MKKLYLLLSLVITLLFGPSLSVQAATHIVTNGSDSGLRQAIALASPGDTINLQTSVTLTSGQLLIDKNLTITGIGGNRTIARSTAIGTPQFRIMEIASNARVVLSNLTISNGNATAQGSDTGGGILSSGNLTINNSTFSNNTATFGGGLYSLGDSVFGGWVTLNGCTFTGNTSPRGGGGMTTVRGVASVTNCTFSNNTAEAGGAIEKGAGNLTVTNSSITANRTIVGGGIYTAGGYTTVIGTTISGNTASRFGGGIYHNGDHLQIIQCTISGNSVTGTEAPIAGGALSLFGPASLHSCTVTNNSAPNFESGEQGGIYLSWGILNLSNCIIAGNTTQDFVVANGTLADGGHNIIGNNTDVATEFPAGAPNGTPSGTSYVGTAAAPLDPRLAPLASNGGPTQTHALLAGSPAIDNGETPFPTDQRGVARPRNGADDIGAFEIPGFTISGYIRTDAMAPIGSVTVQLNRASGVGARVTTDANGFYAFYDLPPDNYVLAPALGGWSFSPASTSLAITTADRSANFTGTRTGPTYSISGRITTPTGQAIPGVSVVFAPTTGGVINPVLTNSAGNYTISNLPARDYNILPVLSGYRFTPSIRNVIVGPGNATGQNFIGTTGYTVSGRLSTSQGIGIAGAPVQLDNGPVVTSNSAGYYTFTSVPAGEHTLTPSLSGYWFSPSSRTITVNSANISGQNFTSAMGYTVSGRLQTSGGIGIVGASVQLDNGPAVTTNSAGYYTFYNVPTGQHAITPSKSGYTFTPPSRTVTVGNSNLSGQNFVGTGPE